MAKVTEPTLVEAPGLAKLEIGGTFQLKGFYHDFSASDDADKRLSFELRRARLDFNGDHRRPFLLRGPVLAGWQRPQLGTESVYLAWKLNDFFGIKGGKLKRPFSQEALSSSKSLYTVERGVLYHDFLAVTHRLFLLRPGPRLLRRLRGRGRARHLRGRHLQRQADQQSRHGAMPTSNTRAGTPGFKAKDFAFRLRPSPSVPSRWKPPSPPSPPKTGATRRISSTT